MSAAMRGLGIGLVATIAYLVMTAFDDGEGGANIGAGLVVFAVLVCAGLGWSLRDAWARGRTDRPRLGSLLGRWVVASALAVAVVEAGQVLLHGTDHLSDLEPSTLVFLVMLVLVPAVVGTLIGYAVRAPDATSGQTRST